MPGIDLPLPYFFCQSCGEAASQYGILGTQAAVVDFKNRICIIIQSLTIRASIEPNQVPGLKDSPLPWQNVPDNQHRDNPSTGSITDDLFTVVYFANPVPALDSGLSLWLAILTEFLPVLV